jgi:glycosyltransferase involved in cell wall biosynthesis
MIGDDPVVDARSERQRREVAYEEFKRRALEAGDAGRAADSLYWAFVAADTAYRYHLGRCADPALERLLRELGPTICAEHPLEGRRPSARGDDGRRRLVHLLSGTVGGGHIAVVQQWVSALCHRGGYEQHLLSTELTPGRRGLRAISDEVASSRHAPPGLTPDSRVRWTIEELAAIDPDFVVLHVDPADVFAICAADQYRRMAGAPLYFFNHADVLFSVGPSLADYVVHYRRASARYSLAYRSLHLSQIRFAPLGAGPEGPPEGPLPARHPGATASVTVANYYKLMPDGHWDFAEMLSQLLLREPEHYHLMVGDGHAVQRIRLRRALRRLPRSARARVLWLGHRSDLGELMRSTDFLIESCPFPGGVVRAHALRCGLPVVAVRHQWPLLSDTDALEPDYSLWASSNEEMVDLASRLIRDPASRRQTGAALARRYHERFSEALLADAIERVLSGEPGPERRELPGGHPGYEPDYLLRYSGPIPGPGALARRAQARIGYPPVGIRGRALRQFDRGLSALRMLAGSRSQGS